jgi:hypothetical protein
MARLGLIAVLLAVLSCAREPAPTVPAPPPAPAPAPVPPPPDEGPGGGPAGKRVGPPAVSPVTVGGFRFEVVHWGRERGFAQNGGYLAAVDPATGEEKWTVRVYETVYDPDLEQDVQDIFIRTLRVRDGRVEVTDERDRRFLVDPATRSVTPQ